MDDLGGPARLFVRFGRDLKFRNSFLFIANVLPTSIYLQIQHRMH